MDAFFMVGFYLLMAMQVALPAEQRREDSGNSLTLA